MRVEKTHFALCLNIAKPCQSTYIMTLHVSCQSTASNREPELFKSTRFWHDLFHFIGHLCGINFKSGRILGQEGVNAEICEQINSFLQCIKYTGSHLSQDHLTFFLQFFLYLMNKDKTRNFQKLAKYCNCWTVMKAV